MTAAIGCVKIPYTTKSLARQALEILFWPGVRNFDPTLKSDRMFEAYECRHCGFFHLGHGRKKH